MPPIRFYSEGEYIVNKSVLTEFKKAIIEVEALSEIVEIQRQKEATYLELLRKDSISNVLVMSALDVEIKSHERTTQKLAETRENNVKLRENNEELHKRNRRHRREKWAIGGGGILLVILIILL